MLSVHFNGHGKDHPEALGRSLREQLDEAFGALGFIRHGGATAPAVSVVSPDKPEPIEPEAADTPDSAQNVAAAEPATEAPKRRGRPPKPAEPKTHEDAGTAYDPGAVGHELQGRAATPEPAPQISASPEDRKPAEPEAKVYTHEDVRQAIGAYGTKFGTEAAVKHGRTFMGLPPGGKIPEIPADRIEAVVTALLGAVESGKAELAEGGLGDLG